MVYPWPFMAQLDTPVNTAGPMPDSGK